MINKSHISCIPLCNICYLSPCICHPVLSDIRYPIPNMGYPISDTQYWLSDILYPYHIPVQIDGFAKAGEEITISYMNLFSQDPDWQSRWFLAKCFQTNLNFEYMQKLDVKATSAPKAKLSLETLLNSYNSLM